LRSPPRWCIWPLHVMADRLSLVMRSELRSVYSRRQDWQRLGRYRRGNPILTGHRGGHQWKVTECLQVSHRRLSHAQVGGRQDEIESLFVQAREFKTSKHRSCGSGRFCHTPSRKTYSTSVSRHHLVPHDLQTHTVPVSARALDDKPEILLLIRAIANIVSI
jgi:hypothetical protein